MINAIETDRLLLRPFEGDDLPALAHLYSLPDVMRYVAPTRDTDETHKRMQKHIRDCEIYGFGLLAAILKSDGTFIGRCGLDSEIVDGELQGELAWMFYPQYWGKSLAPEFGIRMLDIGFNELSLRRIFAHARLENEASIKVMQKIGMRYVGSTNGEIEYEAYVG